jgi:hypothetical protein
VRSYFIYNVKVFFSLIYTTSERKETQSRKGFPSINTFNDKTLKSIIPWIVPAPDDGGTVFLARVDPDDLIIPVLIGDIFPVSPGGREEIGHDALGGFFGCWGQETITIISID